VSAFWADFLEQAAFLSEKRIFDAHTPGTSGVKLKMVACNTLDVADRHAYWGWLFGGLIYSFVNHLPIPARSPEDLVTTYLEEQGPRQQYRLARRQ